MFVVVRLKIHLQTWKMWKNRDLQILLPIHLMQTKLLIRHVGVIWFILIVLHLLLIESMSSKLLH